MEKDIAGMKQELEIKFAELRTKRAGIISRFKNRLKERKIELIKQSMFKK